MLNSLRIHRDRVALEAGFASNMHDLLKDSFPSLTSSLTGFFNRFMPDEQAVVLTSRQNDFIRELSKHSYLDIAPLTAFVPEGLEVTYVDYLRELVPAATHAATVTPKILNEFSLYLSQLINNNDQKFSSVSFEREISTQEKARLEHNKALGKCFKNGSTKTDVSFGQVVDRNSEWPKVFHESDLAFKAMNSVDRKALNKKTAECVQLLEVVEAKIKRGEFEGVSNETVRNLASCAYNIASELEFFSIMFYKTQALASSINRTTERFFQVFEK